MIEQAQVDSIKASVERHYGLHPEKITAEALKKAGCMTTVVALPADSRERLAYLGNVLVQATGIGSEIKGDLRFVVGTICAALTYLFNSQSWRDGELHDFDRDEIRRKLKRI